MGVGVQCVCGVGVVYYAPVHVFVHGASKQPRGEIKTTSQQETI